MFDVVIPVKQSDLYQLRNGIDYIKKNINGRNIIIITDTFQLPLLSWIADDECIQIIDENKVIPGLTLDNIKRYLRDRFGKEERAGWYFQQFIKMAYCEICTDNFYLLWDADTIPLHPISFIDENSKSYLSLKEEHHQPYFSTLQKILGLDKEESYSYIAEHMMIDVSVMKQLINEIEKNDSLKGDSFYLRILNAISDEDMFPSGFSEYETYGTYVMKYFPEKYEKRKIKSLRVTKRIFGNKIDFNLLEWIATTSDYVILTIEESQKPSCLAFICSNTVIRKIFSAQVVIDTWIWLVLKIFKLY